MSGSPSTVLSRPSLGHRSISEQAPLFDPSAVPHFGTRLRGKQAASGAKTATGSILPFSPLLPLPPASTSKHQEPHASCVEVEQTRNLAPPPFPGQRRMPISPSALASRREARRGVSEGFTPLHAAHRTAMAPSPSALAPKTALQLDIGAATHLTGQPTGCNSAGMIRSYSMPVATQQEHDEQRRIMALGISPVSKEAANPAWWQYGWPSPGGVNHRHLQRPTAPEGLGERSRSTQSKLSSVMTPITIADVAAPSSSSSSSSTSRSSSRSNKTHSSLSPKMKSKHLPNIHQHSFQNSSSRSASSSPKMGRSPLSTISINLPAIDQQLVDQEQASSDDEKSIDDTITPDEAAFDIEIDALNQRFAQWSEAQHEAQHVDEDYFNLVHDQPDSRVDGTLRVLEGSDTSDEARTPRASSPRPLSKSALFQLEQHQAHRQHEDHTRWEGNFDFIHPDHLA